jgi:hypothetical protein
MPDDVQIACTLAGGDLERRLAAIARIGNDSLVSHEIEDGRHLLRFRGDAATRRRLEQIVAAEAECCAFLDLTLSEVDGTLALAIAAPEAARDVAAGLAAAFAGGD